MQSLTKGDLARARAELEIAAECTPDDGFVLYQLARAYALGKDQRRALTVLRESVENGFSDLDQLEKKSDFAALRSEADYTRIVDMLKQRLVVSPTAAKRSR
jgi:tetratricopeptide (TPR) repeat protein